MKSKYTYELQRGFYSRYRRYWIRSFFDHDYKTMGEKIDVAQNGITRMYRVVRKQGRKIVKVIYQTK